MQTVEIARTVAQQQRRRSRLTRRMAFIQKRCQGLWKAARLAGGCRATRAVTTADVLTGRSRRSAAEFS